MSELAAEAQAAAASVQEQMAADGKKEGSGVDAAAQGQPGQVADVTWKWDILRPVKAT